MMASFESAFSFPSWNTKPGSPTSCAERYLACTAPQGRQDDLTEIVLRHGYGAARRECLQVVNVAAVEDRHGHAVGELAAIFFRADLGQDSGRRTLGHGALNLKAAA